MANEVTIHVKAKDSASATIKQVSSNYSKVAGVAKVAGAAILGVGVVLLKASAAAREANKVHAQTDAVLKSTGGAAKITAKGVTDLATAISRKTGIDDEAIQSGENLLLTFTNIRNETGKGNDVFNQATQTITDMSVALGQDMKSSAIQVGKALNDPIKGMTALRRVGVSFTEDQEKQVKALVKSGKTLEAQKLILAELRKEFGGSAEAAATWADKAKVAFGNLEENLGDLVNRGLEPVAKWFVNTGAPAIEGFFDKLGKNKDLKRALGNLKETLEEIGALDIEGVFAGLNEQLPETIDGINSVVRGLGKFHRRIMDTEDAMDQGLGMGKLLEFRAKFLDVVADMLEAWAQSPFAPKKAKAAAKAVRAMADEAANAVGDFQKRARDMAREKYEPKFTANDKNLMAKYRTAKQRLADLNRQRPTPHVRAETRQAEAALARVRAKIMMIPKNYQTYVTTYYRKVGSKGSGAFAQGGNVGAHAAEGGPRSNQVLVGEGGPEIVDLPLGSHVNSNPDTQRMMATGGKGGGDTHFHFHGPVYGDHNALRRALVNMKRSGQLDVVLR